MPLLKVRNDRLPIDSAVHATHDKVRVSERRGEEGGICVT